MMFGVSETIRCLQDLNQPGPKGESLCLGHKFTVFHFVGPVGLHDDGYVLGVKGTHQYYELSKEMIAQNQASGALPSPLPGYALAIGDYLWGYSLWIMLAILTPVAIARSLKRRRFSIPNPVSPISTGPPTIETDEDRFVADQVALQLRPREKVSHQAYVRSNVVESALVTLGATAHFAALTNERLILIETRTSLRGPRLENRGVESIERTAIAQVRAGTDGALRIQLRDGEPRVLLVDPKRRAFSNQVTFLVDLPRLFPAPAGAVAATSTEATGA